MVRVWTLVVVLTYAAARAAGPTVDAQGDPLPTGAIARYGSVRFRGPLAAGPDERTLCTLRDNRLCLVDAATGAPVKQLPGPAPESFEVELFSVSDDFRFAAYFGHRGTQLWDLDAGTAVATLVKEQGEASPPWMAARWGWGGENRPRAVFVPNSALVVFNHADKLVCWDIALGREVWKIASEQCQPVGVRPDDNSLVAFAGDFRQAHVLIINSRSGKAQKIELKERHYYAQVALAPDGRQIAVADWEGKLCRYELPSGKKLPDFKAGLAILFGRSNTLSYGRSGLAYSADGTRLITADTESLQVFNAVKNDRMAIVNLGNASADLSRGVVLSGDGSTVWVHNYDHSPWRKFTGLPPKAAPLTGAGQYGPMQGVIAAPAEPMALAVEQGNVRKWSIATGKPEGEFIPAARLSPVYGGFAPSTTAALSADGKRVTMLELRGVSVWDVTTKKRIASVNVGGIGEVSAVALSPNGKVVAIGPAFDWNGFAGKAPNARTVRLHDADTGKEIRSLGEHQEQTTTLTFSADGRRLAALTMDQEWESRGYLLDAESGRVLRALDGATAVAFAPFCDAIAFAAAGEIVLLELSSGDTRVRLKGPQTAIARLVLSNDGRWLAAAEAPLGSRRIHLWDLRTGEALPPLFGHAAAITGLAFAPGGRLVSTSEDATALTWDLSGRAGPTVAPAARAEEFAKAYADLAADGITAHRAIARLLAAGPPTVDHLRQRLRPAAPIDPVRVRDLLAALGARDYAERDRASAALEALDLQFRPQLAAYAATAQSAEARARAARLADRLRGGAVAGERLRELRAVEVLSRLATTEAIALLKELAAGDPEARLTMAAKQAVK